MKKHSFIFLVLVGVALAGCSSYQYTARQVDVLRHSIDTPEQMAAIDVDYSRKVSATSDYQSSRDAAIAEAEFLCIQDSTIDVVVDPIIKVECNPFNFSKRFRATIIGFAGVYRVEPSLFEKSKGYTIEEIEKYKLLTDPNFLQYYYNSGAYYNSNDRKE